MLGDATPVSSVQLVPVPALVSAVARSAHDDLHEALRTLPVLSDEQRKKRLLSHLHARRQQLVRLGALLSWSAKARAVSECARVLSSAASHGAAFREGADSLAFLHGELLAGAAPAYDVATALRLRQRGSYDLLPGVIESALEERGGGAGPGSQRLASEEEERPSATDFGPSEAGPSLEAVEERVHALIRRKLLAEGLPSGMQVAEVEVGVVRVCCRRGYYEAVLALVPAPSEEATLAKYGAGKAGPGEEGAERAEVEREDEEVVEADAEARAPLSSPSFSARADDPRGWRWRPTAATLLPRARVESATAGQEAWLLRELEHRCWVAADAAVLAAHGASRRLRFGDAEEEGGPEGREAMQDGEEGAAKQLGTEAGWKTRPLEMLHGVLVRAAARAELYGRLLEEARGLSAGPGPWKGHVSVERVEDWAGEGRTLGAGGIRVLAWQKRPAYDPDMLSGGGAEDQGDMQEADGIATRLENGTGEENGVNGQDGFARADSSEHAPIPASDRASFPAPVADRASSAAPASESSGASGTGRPGVELCLAADGSISVSLLPKAPSLASTDQAGLFVPGVTCVEDLLCAASERLASVGLRLLHAMLRSSAGAGLPPAWAARLHSSGSSGSGAEAQSSARSKLGLVLEQKGEQAEAERRADGEAGNRPNPGRLAVTLSVDAPSGVFVASCEPSSSSPSPASPQHLSSAQVAAQLEEAFASATAALAASPPAPAPSLRLARLCAQGACRALATVEARRALLNLREACLRTGFGAAAMPEALLRRGRTAAPVASAGAGVPGAAADPSLVAWLAAQGAPWNGRCCVHLVLDVAADGRLDAGLAICEASKAGLALRLLDLVPVPASLRPGLDPGSWGGCGSVADVCKKRKREEEEESGPRGGRETSASPSRAVSFVRPRENGGLHSSRPASARHAALDALLDWARRRAAWEALRMQVRALGLRARVEWLPRRGAAVEKQALLVPPAGLQALEAWDGRGARARLRLGASGRGPGGWALTVESAALSRAWQGRELGGKERDEPLEIAVSKNRCRLFYSLDQGQSVLLAMSFLMRSVRAQLCLTRLLALCSATRLEGRGAAGAGVLRGSCCVDLAGGAAPGAVADAPPPAAGAEPCGGTHLLADAGAATWESPGAGTVACGGLRGSEVVLRAVPASPDLPAVEVVVAWRGACASLEKQRPDRGSLASVSSCPPALVTCQLSASPPLPPPTLEALRLAFEAGAEARALQALAAAAPLAAHLGRALLDPGRQRAAGVFPRSVAAGSVAAPSPHLLRLRAAQGGRSLRLALLLCGAGAVWRMEEQEGLRLSEKIRAGLLAGVPGALAAKPGGVWVPAGGAERAAEIVLRALGGGEGPHSTA